MRIIVTGATSFVGRASADFLKSRNHEVITLRHSFEEEEDLLPANADVWLHFAWAGKGSAGRSDPAIQDYNVRMTMAAVRKANELGCRRFVFAGSQAEYGHAQDGTLKKEYGMTEKSGTCSDADANSDFDVAAPVSEYGKAKLRVLSEALKYCGNKGSLLSDNALKCGSFGSCDSSDIDSGDAESQNMEYVHMRLFSVYGPGDHAGSLIDTLVKGFANGDKVELGPCAQLWNYMYIDDAAAAIALLCEKASQGIYNVAGNDNRKLSDYVREVYELMGRCGSIEFGARADNAEGPADLSADISRITELGFDSDKTVTFAEGIQICRHTYIPKKE